MKKKLEVTKLIVDGNAAVLVSPGYGAGWSTWANDEYREFMVFDHIIAQAVIDKDFDAIERRIKEYAPDVYLHLGGVSDLTVEWVPLGTAFEIQEYDGFESVRVRDISDWMIA